MSELVAIHQPNFFPWLGYFDKILRSDVFIFLDHVQFSKTGGTWSNRVKLLINGEPHWVTVPIKRAFSGVAAVNAVEFSENVRWRRNMLKTLATNYSKAHAFKPTFELLESLLAHQGNNLANFNIHVICSLLRLLGISPAKCIRSSQFSVPTGSNEMLVELTKLVGGNAYLCGGGASGYIDENVFKKNGIRLDYQSFVHPIYDQGRGNFTGGLSIIDVLMHEGVDGAKRLLQDSQMLRSCQMEGEIL